MDANRTRFWLLLGRADWERCSDGQVTLSRSWSGAPPEPPRLAWDDSAQEVLLAPRVYQFLPPAGDRQPSLEARRGAAVDRFGNFYSIDQDGLSVRVTSSGSAEAGTYWPVARPAPQQRAGDFSATAVRPAAPAPPLSGLAISAHHYLLVGTLAPAGLLLFDLHAGGPPDRHLLWPEGVPFVPFDIAATPDGGAWILDRVNRRLWRLDAAFSVVRAGPDSVLTAASEQTFRPVVGPPRTDAARTFPPGLSLDAGSPVDLIDPIGVAALPDGRALLLDRGAGESAVRIYGLGGPQGAAETLSLFGVLESGSPFSRAVVAQDFALAADPGTPGLGRLIVASSDGDQAFAFALREDGSGLHASPQPDYLPLRLFGGRALVASGLDVFYDFGDRFLPVVVARRPRYEREGTLRTFALDGKLRGCVWHRLFLDACIPANTTLQIWTRAADDPDALRSAQFTREPDPRLRPSGTELPFTQDAPGGGHGTFELLFQRLRGRHAQIELRFAGTGGTTPRVRALRAYYPRFSYAERYLPAVYRQDAESYSFLDRYLANPEGFFTSLEDRIAAAQVLFDPRSAPAEALEWLGTWFGIVLDPAWDEPRRRLFLRRAMDFFQWRGTVRGLQMALRLALDECPDESIFTDTDPLRMRYRIVERFRAARTPMPLLAEAREMGIRPASPAALWEPSQGGAALVKRWNEALAAAGVAAPAGRFPVRAPLDAAQLAAWQRFCAVALGFVPRAQDEDLQRFQLFLSRRYKRPAALDEAWNTGYQGFAAVPLFGDLPPDGAPLADWFQFENVALAMRAGAHGFDVYLPAPAGSGADELQARIDRARRVVDAERPAHTTFEVKLYWAMFRLGAVRLGADTLLDLGGRAPALLPPMRLGREHLAQAWLAAGPPQDASDRRILGRDALNAPFTRSRPT